MTKSALPVVRIRDVRSDDVESIVRIYIESWNAGFTKLMPARQATPEVVRQWRADLAKTAPHRWWVAENTAVVGFAGICPSRDPVDAGVGEIDTIAVDPSWWRCGIGRLLMENAIEHLIRDGYRAAMLWTVANYERGQHFYEATGWKTDGSERDQGRQTRYHRKFA